MLRLLHMGDVHLGAAYSAFGDYAAVRREQVLEAFRGMPEVVAQEQLHAVLIAGDLFDSQRPSANVLAAAVETLRRMAENAPVFVVPGNHDPVISRAHPYREIAELPHVHLFTSPCFEKPVCVDLSSGPLAVSGMAYDPGVSRDPLATLPSPPAGAVHVVLLHGAVRKAPHWTPSPNTLCLERAQLAQLEADYIALGDFHRFQSPSDFDPAGKTPACYCGSFAAVDLSETGQRGYVIAELEPAAAPRAVHRSSGVPSVMRFEWDVTGCESENEIIESIVLELEEEEIPVVTLVGSPACPLDAGKVALHLHERCGFASVRDQTHYFDSARLHELSRADTIVGHVARLGRERIDACSDGKDRQVADRALRMALRALGTE